LSGAVAKLASINLQKLVLSPTGSINLDFILREDLLLCLSYLPLGVPNWVPNKHYQPTPPKFLLTRLLRQQKPRLRKLKKLWLRLLRNKPNVKKL
jgi:hypothetical protein